MSKSLKYKKKQCIGLDPVYIMRLSLPGEENGVLEKFLYFQDRPDIYIACCKVIYNVVKLIHKHTKYKVIKVHVNITNITQTEITKSFVSTVLKFGKSFFLYIRKFSNIY